VQKCTAISADSFRGRIMQRGYEFNSHPPTKSIQEVGSEDILSSTDPTGNDGEER